MVEARKLVVTLTLLFATGCSRESMIRSALEDPSDRSDTTQATLKIYDEHPEYVDELFTAARAHEITLKRAIEQAAISLEDPAFCAQVARPLAARPTAVEQMSRAILAEARTRPELRQALAAAILAEGDVMARIVAENPALVQRVLMGSASPPAPRLAPTASPAPALPVR